MSEVKSKPIADALADAALCILIEQHGANLALEDLPWLGGLLGSLRQGYPLRRDQVARISRIRGELARRYHQNGGHAGNALASMVGAVVDMLVAIEKSAPWRILR
jgi:hypothetical protein